MNCERSVCGVSHPDSAAAVAGDEVAGGAAGASNGRLVAASMAYGDAGAAGAAGAAAGNWGGFCFFGRRDCCCRCGWRTVGWFALGPEACVTR